MMPSLLVLFYNAYIGKPYQEDYNFKGSIRNLERSKDF